MVVRRWTENPVNLVRFQDLSFIPWQTVKVGGRDCKSRALWARVGAIPSQGTGRLIPCYNQLKSLTEFWNEYVRCLIGDGRLSDSSNFEQSKLSHGNLLAGLDSPKVRRLNKIFQEVRNFQRVLFNPITLQQHSRLMHSADNREMVGSNPTCSTETHTAIILTQYVWVRIPICEQSRIAKWLRHLTSNQADTKYVRCLELIKYAATAAHGGLV